MAISTKVKGAFAVLREAWFLSRVPPNETIFHHLRLRADETTATPKGLHRYLEDYPTLGRIVIDQDWTYDRSSGEMRLTYSNNIFAPGCLRLKPGKKDRAVIVFLPGNKTGADNVLGPGDHQQRIAHVADKLGMGLACWDWPLQGSRRDKCLYHGLGSVYSCEREYSRIFPALGTSLWRENVAELQFALAQIRRFLGREGAIHIVGWSMGGCFAYLAPLLGTDITSTIAAGSCAGVKDLLAEGKTRVHGYFFYPLNGLAYFDLEDVVGEALKLNHPLQIIYGEHDPGCLESTSRHLASKAAELGRSLQITVLPGHGHVFSSTVKDQIIKGLRGVNLESPPIMSER